MCSMLSVLEIYSLEVDVAGGYNGRGASGLKEGVGCHCQGGMWRSKSRFGRRTSHIVEGT